MSFQYPWRVRALCLATVLAAYACDPSAPSGEGNLGETASPLWTNGDFEIGAAGNAPPSWTVSTFLDPGVTIQSPQTRAGLNLAPGGNPLTVIKRSAAGPETQTDPNLGAGASLRWPKFGKQCTLVNQLGKNKNVNDLSQKMTVAAGDVDSDGLVHIRFVAAPVLENPAHTATEQPYYFVQLTNNTTGLVLYNDFNLSAQAGVPWKISNGYYYTDWQLVDIAPGAAKLKVGDQVTLDVIGSGCSLGGHFGQIYVDGVGTTIPGLFTSGTAAAQANVGTNLTYTITYKNGGGAAAAGVQVDFNLPPNTTYTSISAPGLVCTTPAVGSAGLVHCTIGNLAAGGSGSFQLTVLIGPAASGTLIAGNYDIYGTGITPLLGSKIKTIIGCTGDADCASGNWCDEAASKCTPTLANGVAIPTDLPHTNPTLKGACTAPAGALVCTSAVCDTADNDCGFGNGAGPCNAGNAGVVCRSLVCDAADAKCGYANGDGPCTAGNGGVVCRSLVCDPDLKCGYADGDGPCTVANGPKLCRSGTCSVSGKCAPPGGCNVDADCTAGKWCKEATHACTPRLANGSAVPTDAPHTNPTLNGTCTVAAATLVCTSTVCDTVDNACGYANGHGTCNAGNAGSVCRSGVCDPDTKCGYAVGDGPCTTASAGTVCRSGACSVNGACEPAGGCNADADCGGGNWCSEATHACTPRLSNGTALPTDAPHTNPTLNGMCTTAAATLVCTSQVCDVGDKKCGYADGDGPCTMANAATVCRSMSCTNSGVCRPPGFCDVDADCEGGNWCKESTHTCTAKLANGVAVPTDAPHTSPTLDGTCTAPASALVCTSQVCDTADNECGYANGHGPCTPATGALVCRSGNCAANGTICVPAGGCAVDSDCDATHWCNTATLTCAPKLPNGDPVPTVAGHSPALTGTCTPGAGSAVCTSGVCDPTDNKCGLATGDGPCAGAPQCRAGKCSASKVCVECTSDGECSATQYCDATGKCKAKEPNKDPCAGANQCLSAVCGPDQACGLADGQPCTGAAECRSSACTGAVCGGAATTVDPAAAPDLAASLEGGGCACSEVPRAGGSRDAFAFSLLAALAWVARRRRRADTSTRTPGEG